jgi:hypothetical protein
MHIVHPYTDLTGGQWLKGNLHTHTTRSDGSHAPQAVIDMYAWKNYDFLMLSDHDTYTSEADLNALASRGLVLIPGNEITANGPHILHVDADRLVAPDANRQVVIDQINAGRGFAIVNHPNWFRDFDHCRHEQLRDWQNYAGLEIYNGVIGRLEGSPYATNHWDRLLGSDRRVWGYAHDDMHNAAAGDQALGWNVVYSRERTAPAVARALREGRFYPSTGVVIRSIEVYNNRIRIETENAARIVALREVARRFAIADSSVIDVEVPADAQYVRFECWGTGEKFAWTQPFRIEK